MHWHTYIPRANHSRYFVIHLSALTQATLSYNLAAFCLLVAAMAQYAILQKS